MNKREQYVYEASSIERELKIFLNNSDKTILFDIGACEGLDSVKYSLLFPDSKIYAFEPLEENIKSFYNNLKHFNISNVAVFQLALTDFVGKTSLYKSSGCPGNEKDSDDWIYGNKQSSLFEPNPEVMNKYHSWLCFNDRIDVNANTIDQFCKENNIEYIDFIHMDVQGAELKVLHGASNILKHVKLIWLEVESVELYKSQPLKQTVESFMKRNNFFKLKDTVGEISGDQLYINNNYYIDHEGYIKFLAKKIKSFFRKI